MNTATDDKEKTSGRGGYRPGAGRKPKPEGERYEQIALKLHPELLTALQDRREETGEAVNAQINDAVRLFLGLD